MEGALAARAHMVLHQVWIASEFDGFDTLETPVSASMNGWLMRQSATQVLVMGRP